MPHNSHTSALFYNLRILKLPHLIKLNNASFMYDIFRGNAPNNITSSFNIITSGRRENNFKVNYRRTSIRSKCLTNTGVKIWNSL